MKHWLAAVALVCFCSVARAQVAPPAPVDCTAPASFSDWVSCQQAHAGIGYILKGDKAKYAVTWWDLVQVGGAGLNVAKPSNTLDWVDLGPATAVANDRQPRWGAGLPIHGGNIWNAIKLSPSVASHVVTTKLPAFIIAPDFFYPLNGGLDKWRWDKDFMVSFTYGFGGS